MTTMKKKHKLTVEINTKDDTRKLAAIAFDLGFVAKGGVGAGERGAVGQLVQAIADGVVAVALVESVQ